MPRNKRQKTPGGKEGQDEGELNEQIVRYLIATIHRIKGQKQRPGEERICATMSSKYDVEPEVTLAQLEKAVLAGRVVKLINKGMPSYRDPATISVSRGLANAADLQRMVKKAILLVNLGGCTLREIEEKIVADYGLVQSPDFSEQLKFSIARQLERGELEKHGRIFKVPIIPMETMPPPKVTPSAICSFCLGTEEMNRDKKAEELISCHECGNSGHPSCLQYSKHLVERIKAEPWLCLECKRCLICGMSANADDLLICDACDKGFHMDCMEPPLSSLPEGRWICPACVPPPNRRRGIRSSVSSLDTGPTPKRSRKVTSFYSDFGDFDFYTPHGRKRKKGQFLADFGGPPSEPVVQLPPGVTESDLALFKKAQERAMQAMASSLNPLAHYDPSARLPPVIEFGKYEIKTWYSSPYPQVSRSC